MPDGAGPRAGRRALLRCGAAFSLVLPLVVVGAGERFLADRAGLELGTALATATRGVEHPQIDRAATPSASDLGIGDAPIALPYAAFATSSDRSAPRTRGQRGAAKQARRGILVREPVILRAIASGVRPTGSPASPHGVRPAGLALHGVDGFGSGLHDGDVVTQVGGTEASSPGAVIGAIAGAIRSGARVITAVVWRGDQRLDVAVEIPRPTAR